MTDLYAVLGVDKAATLEQIRTAYHQLALKHHPDRNKGSVESEDIFRGISAAYNVLSDERQRKRYDHEQARPVPRPAFGGAYTQPAPPGEEGWGPTRKYEAVRNSYFYKHSERRRAQNEQRTPQHPVFGVTSFDDLPGTGIQAPIELGTPVPIVPKHVPVLGAFVRVNELGGIPGFSIFRKPV